MTPDEREFFEERAAVLEYDAGMTRLAAETFALELTARRFGVANSTPHDVVSPPALAQGVTRNDTRR